MMRRLSVLCAFAVLLLSRQMARAEFLAVTVDTNLYPATITVNVTPNVDISNGFFFFSQSGTPNTLNLFQTTPFNTPADVTSPLVVSLSGNSPFGVYRSFTEQHALFIGTYSPVVPEIGVTNESTPTGLVAMLSAAAATDAIDNALTFEQVFAGYNEAEMIAAMIAVTNGVGTEDQQSLLFSFAANTLGQQAAFSPVNSNLYNLGPAQLVAFSTATNGGTVDGGDLQIGTRNVVPEPGSLTLCVLGVVSLLACRPIRKKME